MERLSTLAGAGVPPGLAGRRRAGEPHQLGGQVLDLERPDWKPGALCRSEVPGSAGPRSAAGERSREAPAASQCQPSARAGRGRAGLCADPERGLASGAGAGIPGKAPSPPRAIGHRARGERLHLEGSGIPVEARLEAEGPHHLLLEGHRSGSSQLTHRKYANTAGSPSACRRRPASSVAREVLPQRRVRRDARPDRLEHTGRVVL
jgi:hypothetical protein